MSKSDTEETVKVETKTAEDNKVETLPTLSSATEEDKNVDEKVKKEELDGEKNGDGSLAEKAENKKDEVECSKSSSEIENHSEVEKNDENEQSDDKLDNEAADEKNKEVGEYCQDEAKKDSAATNGGKKKRGRPRKEANGDCETPKKRGRPGGKAGAKSTSTKKRSKKNDEPKPALRRGTPRKCVKAGIIDQDSFDEDDEDMIYQPTSKPKQKGRQKRSLTPIESRDDEYRVGLKKSDLDNSKRENRPRRAVACSSYDEDYEDDEEDDEYVEAPTSKSRAKKNSSAKRKRGRPKKAI